MEKGGDELDMSLVGDDVERLDEEDVRRRISGPNTSPSRAPGSGSTGGEIPGTSLAQSGRARSQSSIKQLPSILSGLRGFDAGVLLSLSSATREHLAEMSRQWRGLRRTAMAMRRAAQKDGLALEHMLRSKVASTIVESRADEDQTLGR